MSIFTKIGHFFAHLFNAMKRAYSNLSSEQQLALQQGTGLINLINTMVEDPAEEIRKAIHDKFPDLDEARLETALFEAAASFGLKSINSIDDAIVAIKSHLASLTGKGWAIASHTAASVLAIAFGPADTKVASVVSLIEWVYQHFIKKST